MTKQLDNSEGVVPLLPCPFCGGRAEASDQFSEDGNFTVHCLTCRMPDKCGT